jgi:glutamate formiminotransferase
VLECVVNISEGKDHAYLSALAGRLGNDLLDLHIDGDHNRSVFTLFGTAQVRVLAQQVIATLDIGRHFGVHPRLGVVDVVPFVPLDLSTFDDALLARNEFAEFGGGELGVPCFLYGPERSLPFVRAHAFKDLLPDFGPRQPHPTAGAMCVGVRNVLVAYNLWLKNVSLKATRLLAISLRNESVRALGLQVGEYTQVSMNLIDPHRVGPAEMYDRVAEQVKIERAELVGLVPARVLAAIPRSRWIELDIGNERTIEWRIAQRNHLGRQN